MKEEMKRALHWMSPTTFDGNPIGAMVRTVEVITADTVGIVLFQSLSGVDCAGSMFVLTFFYMARQFALCPKHDVERLSGWREKWNIRGRRPDQDTEIE